MIYFIQNNDQHGHIKIGHVDALGVRIRRRALQVGSPYVQKLLGVMPGWRKTEARLHARHRHNKAKGEWFECTPELLSYIQLNACANITQELIAMDKAQCLLEGKPPRPYTARILKSVR